MTTLPNMLITLPVLGGSSGSWDDLLNAALRLVDAHDHTDGKGVLIRSAAIDIDDDLEMNGNGLTEIGLAAFSAVTALASGTLTMFVNENDNELYFRNSSGTNIQLTSGSTINISLVGGIVGDYSSVGAEVAYDDANDQYTFKQDGTKPWARLASGPVRIYEYNTLESVYVELAVAAALASSYTLTLPAALPATTKAVQVSAAGVVSYSNALTGDVSATGRADITGAILGSSLGFSSSVTLTTSAFAASTSDSGSAALDANGYWKIGTSSDAVFYPFTTRNGDIIGSWAVFISKHSDATSTVSATLYSRSSAGTETAISSASATSAVGIVEVTLGNTISPFTMPADTSLYIKVIRTANADATLDLCRNASIHITHPV